MDRICINFDFSLLQNVLSNMAEGLVQCSLCSKTYIMNKNLYQHMRSVHNVSPQLKGKILCPLNCEVNFRSHKDFRKHLETFHKYMLENETQEFANFKSKVNFFFVNYAL